MWRRRLFALALAVLSSACAAPEAAEQGDVRLGSELYAQHCAMCHGEALKPLAGVKDLRAFGGNFSTFKSTVTVGRDMMPGFSGVFTDEELAALYAYIRRGGGSQENTEP